ncbi:gem-associated protein 6-like [Battus philenor]|uniref:gem-associated protein 6-like n=1 Tax=Battus philenor TaxID=42288 RepID=UPI0035CED54D
MDEGIDISVQGNYSKLKEDPEALLKFINKCCTIQLIKNTTFCGFVHSIDPISKSIILAVPHENTYQITLIPGHAVIDLNEKNENSGGTPFLRLEDSNADVIVRKNKVLNWLKVNLLPVTESGDNIVFGNVQILPPYKVTDICTDNPIVAMQIRKILEKMPRDY